MSIVHVLHFWSPTCGPCMTIKPTIEMIKEDLTEKHGDQIDWISINTKDDPKGRARALDISIVPTFVVFKGDVESGRYSGTQIGILLAVINKAFA
jgi:thiol-disulfide isomerase/thioredoxin